MARDSVVKMSFNLPASGVRVLRRLAQRRGVTMTEVFRQALGTEAYFDAAMRAGCTILVEKRGKVRPLVPREGPFGRGFWR